MAFLQTGKGQVADMALCLRWTVSIPPESQILYFVSWQEGTPSPFHIYPFENTGIRLTARPSCLCACYVYLLLLNLAEN